MTYFLFDIFYSRFSIIFYLEIHCDYVIWNQPRGLSDPLYADSGNNK
jgi:hypothetical protein